MQLAIDRFLQYLRVERNASNYTLKSYHEDLCALADYLAEASAGKTPLPGDITVLDLRGYVAAMHEAGYAKTTIARRLASLRSFFRFGQREGWTKSNPAKPLRNPRKGRSLPHFLSAEDIGRLLESPPSDDPMGLRDRAILETMYSAGLRVSEVVGLNDGDLDFEAD
ncbi:MAG: site-specific integrase, partial [Thermoguttaceae bacterium]